MAVETPDSGVIAMVLAGVSLLWSIITGRRQDERETEDQRRAREDSRRREIHEESVRAVESSGKFVLVASQHEVNARLLSDVAETRNDVRGVSEKLDQLLLGGTLQIRKRD